MKRFLLFFLLSSVAWAETEVSVSITETDKVKIEAFLAGRRPAEVRTYISPHLNMGSVVEIMIFLRAVELGGLDAHFRYVVVPNTARGREMVRTGTTVGGAMAAWHVYYKGSEKDFFESDAVIPDGKFEKGLYATEEKAKTLKIKSVADLQGLRIVSTKSWQIDWTTLEKMKFPRILSVPTGDQQFKMIQSGWADLMLHGFANTPDMSIEFGGLRLYPVPGVKMGLAGSRHFLVSRRHPDGLKVFEALQKGLKTMQKSGEIERAFIESGFYNKTTRNWLLLNPE